jgi:hypothetical protein
LNKASKVSKVIRSLFDDSITERSIKAAAKNGNGRITHDECIWLKNIEQLTSNYNFKKSVQQFIFIAKEK